MPSFITILTASWWKRKTQSNAATGFVQMHNSMNRRLCTTAHFLIVCSSNCADLFFFFFFRDFAGLYQAKFHAVCSFAKFCEILELLNPNIPDTLCRTIFDQALEYLHEVTTAPLLIDPLTMMLMLRCHVTLPLVDLDFPALHKIGSSVLKSTSNCGWSIWTLARKITSTTMLSRTNPTGRGHSWKCSKLARSHFLHSCSLRGGTASGRPSTTGERMATMRSE